MKISRNSEKIIINYQRISAFDDDFDNDQADLIDPGQGGQPERTIADTIKEKTLNAVKIVGEVVNK